MQNPEIQKFERIFSSSLLALVPKGSRVMLGYSGGPDSEALLQMYLASPLRADYPLHLVHVDHGWRDESHKEALHLQEKALKWGLPFHLVVLNPSQASGNLESWSRKERYAFFEKVGQEIGTPWLLLGHHKDDSLEVVLRRLLEGSHLIHASGIAERSVQNSLHVLRPLLLLEKEDLLLYVQSKKASWIHDKTNEDLRFQRASMRQVLFPALSTMFRKNIKSSLYQLSQEASFLKEHVQEELKEKFHCESSSLALFCRKKQATPPSRFLWMQAIHSACTSLGVFLSRDQEMKAVSLLHSHEGGSKLFSTKETSFYVDKDSFLLLKRTPLKHLPEKYFLDKEGDYCLGSWTIRVTKGIREQESSFWDLFSNGFSFAVEELPLMVVPSNEKNVRLCSGGRKEGAPASLRKKVPLFMQNEQAIAAPCCSWKKKVKDKETNFVITVRMAQI